MTTMPVLAFAILAPVMYSQTFDVASVKPSAKAVGPDYNNQIALGPTTFNGRNVTLKRLIVEAYGVEPSQIFGGPKWLAENEYDIDAKVDRAVSKDQLRTMLQPLLAARFRLAIHRETRELKVYELSVDKGGPKIQPVKDGEGTPAPLGSPHFHGELRELANLISVQLTIPVSTDDPTRPSIASGAPVPVFDKTGLTGTYDFDMEGRRGPGEPSFNRWQSVLQEQLGLKLESRKAQVEGIVVDSAERVPVAN
jgi:uncharacterized protein (TIGR03435 family)